MTRNTVHVLMTTPSLDTTQNVSGIASVVRGIQDAIMVEPASLGLRLSIFTVGKKDKQARSILWLLGQLTVPISFSARILFLRPQIVHLNAPLSRFAIPRDYVLLQIARVTRRRVVLHLHGGPFIHSAPKSWLKKYMVRGMLRRAEAVLVLGENEARSVKALYKANPGKLYVMPNAVRVPPTIESRRYDAKLNVLSLGRLDEEKGLDVLCDAVEAWPRARNSLRLVLCGAGPLQTQIVTRLEKALGGSFHFGGVVTGLEREATFARADVLLLPSLYGEGLPMVLIEAMSRGVVPVATPDGSIPEVLSDGKNGFLIAKSAPDRIIQVLADLAERKRHGELRALAEAAHATVVQNYNLERYIWRLAKIYDARNTELRG